MKPQWVYPIVRWSLIATKMAPLACVIVVGSFSKGSRSQIESRKHRERSHTYSPAIEAARVRLISLLPGHLSDRPAEHCQVGDVCTLVSPTLPQAGLPEAPIDEIVLDCY